MHAEEGEAGKREGRGGRGGSKSFPCWCTILTTPYRYGVGFHTHIPHFAKTFSHLNPRLDLSLDDNLSQVCQALAIDDGEGHSVLRKHRLELQGVQVC